MQSAGLRTRAKPQQQIAYSTVEIEDDVLYDMQPPRYVIDLSLPPSHRYDHLAPDFQNNLGSLPALFDDVVGNLSSLVPVVVIRWFAWLFLRRVYGQEETEELRGIQRTTGLDMYLLVAFNVLLDLLMGCTSGGVRVKEKTGRYKMLHFRTLDWGMDELRKLIIRLDYIEHVDGPIVASTVTYFGFVGILTGVREGMSVSLNFRPTHNARTWLVNMKFRLHQLLVLLGIRPSVSSLLRRCLIPSKKPTQHLSTSSTLEDVESKIQNMHSTAAYLIISDGMKTITMEKDNGSAVVNSATDFIVALNHDSIDELSSDTYRSQGCTDQETLEVAGIESIVKYSKDRKFFIVTLWHEAIKREQRKRNKSRATDKVFITQKTLEKWIDEYPITNEETHFACIMDPEAGEILWTRHYMESIEQEEQDI